MRIVLPAVIALGSNLGDRAATLAAAIHELSSHKQLAVQAVSHFYHSDAVKPEGVDRDAPAYLNAVILVRSALSPHQLLAELHRIEQLHGRVRHELWGDRTLDLDLISFAGFTFQDQTLTLPHPRAWQRAFVLAPWCEIQPNAEIPGRGTVKELWEKATDQVQLWQGATS